MRILGLWLDNYSSGTATERFKKPLEALGHQLDILSIDSEKLNSELLKRVENYDLLFHLPYRDLIRREIIQYISKETDVITVLWNGDDEWQSMLEGVQNSISMSNDYNYTVTTWATGFKNGIYDISKSRVLLGQWGFSEEDWKPKKVEKDIDIYFCGGRTQHRDFYLRYLKDEGFNVLIQGPGYSGKLDLKTMINNYRRSKIALSFVIDNKSGMNYAQIKARTFEIPAVKTFQLSEYCPELKTYFNIGSDLDTFENADELIKSCKYYLEHDKEREVITSQGYLSNKKNSYEAIFTKLFKEIDYD